MKTIWNLTVAMVILLCTGLISSEVLALVAGDLDPTFGEDGIVAIDFSGSHTDYGQDVAVQDDGKIVVAGYSDSPPTWNNFAVTRYNEDGSLDTTFGTDGRVTTGFGTYDGSYIGWGIQQDYGRGVAVDSSSGRIVVVGTTSGPLTGPEQLSQFAIACYNNDGSLDTSFDGDGMVNSDLGYDYSTAYSVVVDGNGKIVVAGYATFNDPWDYDFAVVRYNPDGSLDTTFGTDGVVTTDFESTYDKANSLVIDSLGKIVVAGESGNNFALARYNADGTLDTAFDGDGRVITDFGASGDFDGYDVAIDSEGRIVMAGYARFNSGQNEGVLARYNEDGSLDETFDSDGMVIIDFGSGQTGYGAVIVAVDSQDRIVAAGRSYFLGRNNFAIARYNPDGSLDPTFGNGGSVTTDFDLTNDIVNGLAIDGAGRIVAAGRSYTLPLYSNFALARYHSDGTLDTCFDEDGLVTTDFVGSNHDSAYDSVAVHSDGKIVVGGHTRDSGGSHSFALARLNGDGTLDMSFGADGRVVADFSSGIDIMQSLAVQDDGKIVTAGSVDSNFAVARFNYDGSLDLGFGDAGLVITDLGDSTSEEARSVAIQTDGRILVGGTSGTAIGAFLACYNADGSPDTNFGMDLDNNGIRDGITTNDQIDIMDIVIQPDGKIVTGGGIGDFQLARYNADGSLDTSFDGDGMVHTDFNVPGERILGVAIGNDGRIFATGWSGTGHRLALAAYHPDGSLDTSFGVDGLVTTNHHFLSVNLIVDSQGRIVVSAYAWVYDFGVARFLPDGSPDPNFGTDGFVRTDFGFFYEIPRGLDIDADGQIVMAGYSCLENTGYDFIVVRYIGEQNRRPVANAGTDQSVHQGTVVTLDGSASSDPDENYPLTYSWQITSMPEGSTTELWDANTVSPTLIPDLMGDYTIELVVTDSLGAQSTPDSVLVSTYNTPPVADAGDDQAVIELGTIIQLDGTQSWDDDGDDIAYLWTIDQKPAESLAELSDPCSPAPTFVADVHGDYVISLTVMDCFGAASEPDTVTVSFTNVTPVADAGDNQAVIVGDTVFLNGSASHDENHDPLTYRWSFVSRPADSMAEFDDSNSVQTTFVADQAGTYIVSLVVNDGFVDSEPSNVTIEVISIQDGLVDVLREAIDTINLLDPNSLKNENMKKALTNKINAVLHNIENGLYDGMLNKLRNDLLKKTDGCAEIGEPDNNDWLITCEAQNQVYPLIMEAIELLEALI